MDLRKFIHRGRFGSLKSAQKSAQKSNFLTNFSKKHGNSLLYFLITPLCVKVNCNISLQLTFTQVGVKINSKQNGVNFYTKWCNPRLLVATANFAEATACSVTRRSLHGPGSNSATHRLTV